MTEPFMTDTELATYLDSFIRTIPDFPKPGIQFKDITPLLKNDVAFSTMIRHFSHELSCEAIDYVIGIESRGFILGAPLAYEMGKGFIPVRKPGKLPADKHAIEYALEYGFDTLEIHRDALQPGDRVVILDDLLATGGTAAATVKLVQACGAEVVAVAFGIELTFLKGREKLAPCKVISLIQY